MSLFKYPVDRGVPPSRTQQTIVEERAKQLEDFRRMLGANAGAADYLEPATPRRGMDLLLYIEAELERQRLQQEIADLEAEIDQLKEFLATEFV
jgi:hypothetical protein